MSSNSGYRWQISFDISRFRRAIYRRQLWPLRVSTSPPSEVALELYYQLQFDRDIDDRSNESKLLYPEEEVAVSEFLEVALEATFNESLRGDFLSSTEDDILGAQAEKITQLMIMNGFQACGAGGERSAISPAEGEQRWSLIEATRIFASEDPFKASAASLSSISSFDQISWQLEAPTDESAISALRLSKEEWALTSATFDCWVRLKEKLERNSTVPLDPRSIANDASQLRSEAAMAYRALIAAAILGQGVHFVQA